MRRLALAVLFAASVAAAHADGLRVGDTVPAPDVETTAGRIIPAPEFSNKVVLHYFWATWCFVCRGDLPELQKLYQTYRARGFEIVAHALDRDQVPVIDYWRERGYTFPAAMRSDAIRAHFGPIQGTPTFFLVDRAVKVRLKRLGLLPGGELARHIKILLSQ